MSLSFLGQKSFHPSNPKTLAKLFAAEQKLAHEAKRAEELKHEAEQEEARKQARALLGGAAAKDTSDSAISFMYQKPPGMAEAQSRQERKQRDEAEKTKAERDVERFPVLKNAPRSGDYTNDMEVTHKPFGMHLRKVQCKRCQQWGHAIGDRECPLRDTPDAKDDAQKGREDPLGRAAGTEASGVALRWAPKTAPDGGVLGAGVSASDENQQFLPMVDDEEMAMAAAAAAASGEHSGVAMEELDPAVLSLLTEKQRRKLLKMYQRELRQVEGESGADADGESHKRKRHHKDKHHREKHHHRDKHHKDKRHKDKGKHKHSRRNEGRSRSRSGSASSDEDE